MAAKDENPAERKIEINEIEKLLPIWCFAFTLFHIWFAYSFIKMPLKSWNDTKDISHQIAATGAAMIVALFLLAAIFHSETAPQNQTILILVVLVGVGCRYFPAEQLITHKAVLQSFEKIDQLLEQDDEQEAKELIKKYFKTHYRALCTEFCKHLRETATLAEENGEDTLIYKKTPCTFQFDSFAELVAKANMQEKLHVAENKSFVLQHMIFLIKEANKKKRQHE